MRIYLASSLHDQKSRNRNLWVREVLERHKDVEVLLPQDNGTACDILDELHAKNPDTPLADLRTSVRLSIYAKDMDMMIRATCCLAYMDRVPSEGQLWEMGWFNARGIPVYVINTIDHDLGVMVEMGSHSIYRCLDDFIKDVLE